MFLDVDWTNCFGTLIEYVAERMLFDSPMRFYLYTVTKSTVHEAEVAMKTAAIQSLVPWYVPFEVQHPYLVPYLVLYR
jgi:hypothetical protein